MLSVDTIHLLHIVDMTEGSVRLAQIALAQAVRFAAARRARARHHRACARADFHDERAKTSKVSELDDDEGAI